MQRKPMIDVSANVRAVLDRIHAAAEKCGRDPASVGLLAASKSQSAEKIHAAIAAGVRLVGENYVQEAKEKQELVTEAVEWHMIGHLQRNKVKAAMELFDLIETLDSSSLARALDKQGVERGRNVRVFVEVNLAAEESKSGIAKEQLRPLLEEVGTLSHVRVEGLMTVPPFRENPEEVRPYFRALRELQLDLRELKIPNVELRELSMGMTHDFPVAIEEGATIVRVGTAIFGPRED